MVSVGASCSVGAFAAEDRCGGGFRVHPRAGEAPLLCGQRPSGVGPGGAVQAVAARLSVRSSFGASADAGGGGERGLPLVPWLKLRDKVPDASTLSQNRRRRFAESTIYQEIFDEIVLLAVNKGLASGKVLYTDSTHLKANANKNKFDLATVQVKPSGVSGGAGCGGHRGSRGAWQGAIERAHRRPSRRRRKSR